MRPTFEYFKDKKEDRVSKRTFIWFVIILVSFYLLIFFTNLYFQANFKYIQVNGLSMQPTLNQTPVYVTQTYERDGNKISEQKIRLDLQELTKRDLSVRFNKKVKLFE